MKLTEITNIKGEKYELQSINAEKSYMLPNIFFYAPTNHDGRDALIKHIQQEIQSAIDMLKVKSLFENADSVSIMVDINWLNPDMVLAAKSWLRLINSNDSQAQYQNITKNEGWFTDSDGKTYGLAKNRVNEIATIFFTKLNMIESVIVEPSGLDVANNTIKLKLMPGNGISNIPEIY